MTPESLKGVVEFIKVVAWPLAFVLAILIFRKPLTHFLNELAPRITKVSAFEVSIELATVPSPPVPWADPTLFEGPNLTGGDPTTTTIMELFGRIHEDTVWHYLIVDIGTGRSWLTSRLFLFTVVLQYLSGLKCVVFVATKEGDLGQQFLGLASPRRILSALAGEYPGLEPALGRAWVDQGLSPLVDRISKVKAEGIVTRFMGDPGVRQSENPQSEKWERLGTAGIWEHARWLDLGRLRQDLGKAMEDLDLAQLVDSPEASRSERVQAILRRQVPYVALVNSEKKFKGLVDREALLRRAILRLTEVP